MPDQACIDPIWELPDGTVFNICDLHTIGSIMLAYEHRGINRNEVYAFTLHLKDKTELTVVRDTKESAETQKRNLCRQWRMVVVHLEGFLV